MPEENPTTRTCSKCAETKPSELFTYNRARAGYEGPCKNCTKKRQAAWLRKARAERGVTAESLPPNASFLVNLQRDDLISRIEKNSAIDIATGCREWLTAKERGGYGMLFVSLDGRWFQIGAHRIIASIFRGLDLTNADELACHRCDNPCCTAEGHIFKGSHSDNTRDAVAKGRMKGHPRIPETVIREVRRLVAAGSRVTDVSRSLNIQRQYVRLIADGKVRRKA